MNQFLNKTKKYFEQNKYLVIFFVLSLVIFSLWLLAFYPGIMTPDSNDQWSQAFAFHFNNHHPYLHTLIIALLQRIWYNPAFICVIQILIASFLPAFFLNYLIKKGLNKFVAFFLLILYLSSPSIGIFNVTLWKDIPFSLGIFALSIFFVMHYLEGGFPNSKVKLALFALLIVVLSYLRHNGILFILLIPTLYLLFRLINTKKFVILITICLIGYLFINNVLAGLLNVSKPNFINSVTLIHLVSSAIDSGYQLSDEQRITLEKLISIESIKKNYDCINANSLVFNNPDFHPSIIENAEYKKEFDKLAIDVIRMNIPQVMGNRTCAFLNLIGFNSRAFLYGEPGISADMERFHLPEYKENALSKLLLKYVSWSSLKDFPQLIYWNVLPFILITLLVALIKRNGVAFGYLIISLFNLLPLAAGGVGGDYRFVYSIQITGIFMLALLFLPRVLKSISKTD